MRNSILMIAFGLVSVTAHAWQPTAGSQYRGRGQFWARDSKMIPVECDVKVISNDSALRIEYVLRDSKGEVIKVNPVPQAFDLAKQTWTDRVSNFKYRFGDYSSSFKWSHKTEPIDITYLTNLNLDSAGRGFEVQQTKDIRLGPDFSSTRPIANFQCVVTKI